MDNPRYNKHTLGNNLINNPINQNPRTCPRTLCRYKCLPSTNNVAVHDNTCSGHKKAEATAKRDDIEDVTQCCKPSRLFWRI